MTTPVTQTNILAAARLELSDPAAAWSDNELIRCIDQVTGDISRLLPLESVYELTVDAEVTDEAWTSSLGVAVSLTYKPLKFNSELVTDSTGATTYLRDSDYTMDYHAGTITALATGDIPDSTGCLISYSKSRIAIDISSLSAFQVLKVEWPASDVPQNDCGFVVFDDILWVTSSAGKSQAEFSDSQHIRVYYTGPHTAPGASRGTYPAFLDEVVVKGVVAYALFIKHRENNLAAVTAEDAAATALALAEYTAALTAIGTHAGNAGTAAAAASTAIASLTTDLAAVSTSLDRVSTLTTGATDSVKAQLTLAAAEFAAADAAAVLAATGTSDALSALSTAGLETSMKTLLTLDQADTDLTLAKTDLTNAASALAKVATYMDSSDTTLTAKAALKDILDLTLHALTAAALDKVPTILDLLHKTDASTGDLKNAESVWTDEVKHILTAASIPNAEDLLETGDDLINAVNLGDQAAAEYRQYADVTLKMAALWADKRKDFLTEAEHHANEAAGYVNEASARLGEIDRLVSEALAWGDMVKNFIGEAGSRIDSASRRIAQSESRASLAGVINNSLAIRLEAARAKVAEAEAYINSGVGYVQAASQYAAAAQSAVAEGSVRVDKVRVQVEVSRAYSESAAQYAAASASYARQAEMHAVKITAWMNLAGQRNNTADRFLADARDRHADYWTVLSDRIQMMRRRAQSSTRQYSTGAELVEGLAKLTSN